MSTRNAFPPTTPTRSRRPLRSVLSGAVASALAVGVALGAAPGASAVLHAGVVTDYPGSAQLAVERTFVPPAGDGAATDPGIVGFSGTGYNPGEVLVVRVDDGKVLPETAPPVPPGGDPALEGGFTWVTADDEGRIAGTVDLAHARPADRDELATGKHELRVQSSSWMNLLPGNPAGAVRRSLHVDFAVRSGPVPNADVAKDVKIGPGLWHGGSWLYRVPFVPYSGIPKLTNNSSIPYRIAGFGPHQRVAVKVDDTDLPAGSQPDGAWAVIETDASGSAAGVLDLRGLAMEPGAHWLRFVSGSPALGGGPVRSVVAAYAVIDDRSSPRSVGVAPTVQRGRSLLVSGTGLLREPFFRQDRPESMHGQSLRARLKGTNEHLLEQADQAGSLGAWLPIPADTPLGPQTVEIFVGFYATNDFPQLAIERQIVVTDAPRGPHEPPAKPVVRWPALTGSTRVKVSKQHRFGLRLKRGSKRVKTTVTVRTASKYRTGASKKRRAVTVAPKRTLTVPAGNGTTKLTLRLTSRARTLLRQRKSLRVDVRVAPQGGKASTKRITLRR
jgi:hypothetical protein